MCLDWIHLGFMFIEDFETTFSLQQQSLHVMSMTDHLSHLIYLDL